MKRWLILIIIVLAGCGTPPFAVPIYPDASSIYQYEASRTVQFWTKDTPQEVRIFYAQALAQEEWILTETHLHTDDSGGLFLYKHGAGGLVLSVGLGEQGSTVTELRLGVYDTLYAEYRVFW